MALPVPAVSRQRSAQERAGVGAAGRHDQREEDGCSLLGGEDRMKRVFTAEERRGHRGHAVLAMLGTLFPLRPLRTSAVKISVAVLLTSSAAFGALEATDKTWDGSEPPQGIYFHWYQP